MVLRHNRVTQKCELTEKASLHEKLTAISKKLTGVESIDIYSILL